MSAYRLLRPGEQPVLVETEVPAPGPDEVLVEVLGAGLCGTDLAVIDGRFPGAPAPFTLGHENAGRVVKVGSDVGGWTEGEMVVVSCIDGCGRCGNCLVGRENYCPALNARGITSNGGLAQFMVASARQLCRTSLDPAVAAPLADAGLTAYHAVRSALARSGDASAVLVIGVGGLGMFAVQYARLLTTGPVIAMDISPERVAWARGHGADQAVGDASQLAGAVGDCTRGDGVAAVVDLVGSAATLELAAKVVGFGATIAVTGNGGGSLEFSRTALPPGTSLVSPRGGSLAELREVVALAESGRLHLAVDRFGFAEFYAALEKLRGGRLTGRAVLTAGT